MEKYYRDDDFNINTIRTILSVQDNLGKERTNKLISLLNKKIQKRYNLEDKRKDNVKMLIKYRVRRIFKWRKKQFVIECLI